MIQSIKLTKYIRKFLLNNSDLQKLVKPTAIFPIVAQANTKFPYIVMQRTGINAKYSKAGLIEDNATIEIIAVSNDYSNSIDIAQEIRKTLDAKRFRDEEIWIDNIEIESITEEYTENAYLQRLIFNMSIRDTEE